MSSVDVELPAEASSAAAARSAVRALVLDGDHRTDPQSLDRVLLLTSEVVTNAILHARTPLRLTARLDAGEVVVRVYDSVRSLPRRRAYQTDAGTGRGMHLIEALADEWGVEETSAGKCVWFAVMVAAGERAARLG